MKKIILAALAVSVLASCGKDNNGPGKATGEKAMLNISLTSDTNSKATGTVPNDDTAADVKNFTVFVTEGETVYPGYSSDGKALNQANSNAITATTTADHIYVVANSGDLTGLISSTTELLNFLADLNGTSTIDGSQTAIRWASGDVGLVTADFIQNGDDFVATKAIAIKFISARIVVTVDNQMTKYGDTGSLELKSVTVLNAGAESKLFGASLIPATKKYYSAIDGSAFVNWPASFTLTPTLLSDALKTPLAKTDTYYYYVFENNATTAATFPTIVTLTGKDHDGTDLYWPVHIAPYEQLVSGTAGTVTRGNSYNINIKLTGDATNGGGGTTDPTNPVSDAMVEVSITMTPWNPVTLEKEF